MYLHTHVSSALCTFGLSWAGTQGRHVTFFSALRPERFNSALVLLILSLSLHRAVCVLSPGRPFKLMERTCSVEGDAKSAEASLFLEKLLATFFEIYEVRRSGS
jgi:hypothetical protein